MQTILPNRDVTIPNIQNGSTILPARSSSNAKTRARALSKAFRISHRKTSCLGFPLMKCEQTSKTKDGRSYRSTENPTLSVS